MGLRGFKHVIIAHAFPQRRDQQRAIDACTVHFLQQMLSCERLRAVRRWNLGRGGQPGPLRRAWNPDMYLTVDDQHFGAPRNFRSGIEAGDVVVEGNHRCRIPVLVAFGHFRGHRLHGQRHQRQGAVDACAQGKNQPRVLV